MCQVSETTVTEQLSPALLKLNLISFSLHTAALQPANAYCHPPRVQVAKARDTGPDLSRRGAMKSSSSLLPALFS